MPDGGCLCHPGLALFLSGTIIGIDFGWDNRLFRQGLDSLLNCSANKEVADTNLDGCWANLFILVGLLTVPWLASPHSQGFATKEATAFFKCAATLVALEAGIASGGA